MKRKVWVLIGISLFFVGCGSDPKKDDSDQEVAVAEEKAAAPVKEAPKPPVADEYRKLRAAIKSRSDSEILREASQLLEKNSKDVKVLNALAMHHYRLKRMGLAKILLQRAFAVESKRPELLNNLGLIHLAESKQAQATQAFRQALGISSNYAPAAANLGSLYVKNGDYGKAALVLGVAVQKFPNDQKILHNYAVSLAQTGKTSEAEQYYERAMKLNNSDSTLLLNYAILLIEKLDKMDKGAELLEKLKFAGIGSGSRDRVWALEQKIKGAKK